MTRDKSSSVFRVAEFLVTAGGIGNAPIAPGTFGSLPGVFIGMWLTTGIASHPFFYWPLAIGLLAIAIWSVIIYENVSGTHDESRIVIDEVMGQAIALLPAGILKPEWFLQASLAQPNLQMILYTSAGFVLFRIFDIWKPGLIGHFDRENHTPLGTCLDDILAGIVAAAVLTVGMQFGT